MKRGRERLYIFTPLNAYIVSALALCSWPIVDNAYISWALVVLAVVLWMGVHEAGKRGFHE